MSEGVKKFEDLECWREARALVGLVYDLTCQGEFLKDFGLRDQIRKAAVSCMANVSEGFGTYSNVEFIRFLGFSSRSCFEVQSHLYVALDRKYIQQNDFEMVYRQAQSCANLIKGFIRYLRNGI